jgi:hypothetical protein
LNARPLTNISTDADDPNPLTPNHFLIGWRSGKEFSGADPVNGKLFDEGDLYSKKSWRVAQRLADMFWSRWIKEYLPTLSRRSKWNIQRKSIKPGDIVIVADDQAPRNSWMKGRVVAVRPGKDGVVRVADVKTIDGTYRRPVVKLCPLDVKNPEKPGEESLEENTTG